MNENEKNVYLEDEANVSRIIGYIRSIFPQVYYDCTCELYRNNNVEFDPESIKKDYDAIHYYVYGHCLDFYFMLANFFGESAIAYDDSTHIITKIGNSFWDITGNLGENYAEKRGYRESGDAGLCAAEIAFYKKDDLNIMINKRIVELVKNNFFNEQEHSMDKVK